MLIEKISANDFEKVKSKEKTIDVCLVEGVKSEVNIGTSILYKKEPDLIEGVIVKVTDIKYLIHF